MLLVVLAAVLLMPTALALDQEEILQDQSQSLGIEDLEEAGEAYTGQHDIEDGLDVGASFRHMAETGKEALGGRAKKKAFVPVKGRRPRKHFAVPPVTCVPTYALPVTGDTGRAYFPRFGVRPAAQEGYSDFRATSFGLSPSPNRCRVPQILLSPSSPL